jgi:hypothetical protein
LLVDRYLVEQMQRAVELRLHEPVPQEVVLVHDKLWEGNSCGYHTIFQDGPIYRMYYRGWNHNMKTEKQTHRAVVCYAQSRDGIHWERPVLHLVEFQGSRENNIIWAGIGTHNFVPFKDTNPQCLRRQVPRRSPGARMNTPRRFWHSSPPTGCIGKCWPRSRS